MCWYNNVAKQDGSIDAVTLDWLQSNARSQLWIFDCI
jgi:hypothetical protein